MSTKAPRLALAVLILALGSLTARADIVPVVSIKSPITTLTKNEIVDIFLRKRFRFPDGQVAVPIDQAEGSAARDQFYSQFAELSPAQLKAFWAKIIFTGRGQPPRSVASGKEARKLVATDPNAITYLDRSLVDGTIKVVTVP